MCLVGIRVNPLGLQFLFLKLSILLPPTLCHLVSGIIVESVPCNLQQSNSLFFFLLMSIKWYNYLFVNFEFYVCEYKRYGIKFAKWLIDISLFNIDNYVYLNTLSWYFFYFKYYFSILESTSIVSILSLQFTHNLVFCVNLAYFYSKEYSVVSVINWSSINFYSRWYSTILAFFPI